MMGERLRQGVKRSLDVTVALTLLVLGAPLLAAVAYLIVSTMGRPALFRQERAGLHGRAFRLYKFRTMTTARDAQGELLPDAMRLPPVGRFLRSTSLDELPQLFNVLRGEMSLVGPRPLLLSYLPRYNAEQRHRHAVKPGITGWAQIHGRNALRWEDKFAYDVWYARHWTLRLDLCILLKTAWRVVQRSGVGHGDQVTMPEFMGTQQPLEEK